MKKENQNSVFLLQSKEFLEKNLTQKEFELTKSEYNVRTTCLLGTIISKIVDIEKYKSFKLCKCVCISKCAYY